MAEAARGRGRPRKDAGMVVTAETDVEVIEEDFLDPDPEELSDDDLGDLGLDDDPDAPTDEEIEELNATVSTPPAAPKPQPVKTHKETIDTVTAQMQAEENVRKAKAEAAIKARKEKAAQANGAAKAPALRVPARRAPAAVPKKISAELLQGLRTQLTQIADAMSDAEEDKLHKASVHVAQAITWIDAVRKFS